jgi:hypothetical protein
MGKAAARFRAHFPAKRDIGVGIVVESFFQPLPGR